MTPFEYSKSYLYTGVNKKMMPDSVRWQLVGVGYFSGVVREKNGEVAKSVYRLLIQTHSTMLTFKHPPPYLWVPISSE